MASVVTLGRRRGAEHRRIGKALGVPEEVVDVVLSCECGAQQTEMLKADEPARAACADVSCLVCGRLGMMVFARRRAG